MLTPPSRRRRVVRNLARATARILAVLGLIALSGITVQANAEQGERREFPPPGQLVDIGGGDLIHLRQWGVGNPGPTIVLDVSAATPSSLWAWVGPALGEHHRVVAFDRPGMAWSRGPWAPRDSQRAADALAKALYAADISPPYVIVGHSYGGFSSRVFAGSYRDQVAGRIRTVAARSALRPTTESVRGWAMPACSSSCRPQTTSGSCPPTNDQRRIR